MKYIRLYVMRIPEVQLSREDGVFPMQNNNAIAIIM